MRAPTDSVPSAVRIAVKQSIATHPGDDEVERIARTLLTDQRMGAVWRILKQRKPALTRAEMVEYWNEEQRRELQDLTDADVALALFMRCCIADSTCPNVIDTVPELREAITSYEGQATRLRGEATKLRNPPPSAIPNEDEIEAHVKALEGVAAWCDDEAASLREAMEARDPKSPVIERDKGWRREMGLAGMIAPTVKWLFGLSHYGTVAMVVNVITERTVGRDGNSGIVREHHVRGWIRALRIRDD